LPIHYAAKYSTLDVVELLLEAYPELQYKTDSRNGHNLLHYALGDPWHGRAVVNAKVQHLCDHYPDILRNINNQGLTLLMYHVAISSRLLDLKQMQLF
jgi:ankyrin repeat protein